MNNPDLPRFSSRLPLLLSTGLLGCAVGWGWHASLRQPAGTASGSVHVATAPVVPPPAAEDAAAKARAESLSAREVLERMFTADSTDMINLMEAIGGLTRLSDAEVRSAWLGLAQRSPGETMGSAAAVLYLWNRMGRLGESVELPRGWGAENFQATIELAKVRDQMPRLLARLEAGEALSEAERRVVFTDMLRGDPVAAVKLWVKNTKPWDFQGEARYFGDALSEPSTRDLVMAELRAWQGDNDLGGATLALAWNWISRDPAAVEQWLRQPEQEDVRATVMQHVVNVRVLANPAEAWAWSGSLPAEQRQRALGMSAGQLANQNPETGARLIAALQAPAERQEAIRQYGKTLAANNLEQWKTWRETLPEAERVHTNQSAFDLWVFHEPDNAVRWLNTQPAGSAKDEMIATLVDVYAARDPKVAADWIQSIPDPARRRDAAVAALSSMGPGNLESVRTILDAAQN